MKLFSIMYEHMISLKCNVVIVQMYVMLKQLDSSLFKNRVPISLITNDVTIKSHK